MGVPEAERVTPFIIVIHGLARLALLPPPRIGSFHSFKGYGVSLLRKLELLHSVSWLDCDRETIFSRGNYTGCLTESQIGRVRFPSSSLLAITYDEALTLIRVGGDLWWYLCEFTGGFTGVDAG